MLTVGSLFSGIGGLDLAAQWAGFETAWFVEKEPFCQQVLAKHWPGVPLYRDIFDCHDLPPVDVICGGFPCQPFSVAGKRQGADDERYLLPEMLRIIREVQPYAVLFENVPGFPSLTHGAEFKSLLRALAEMGFDAEWSHLRASDAGAPHQRERWFCVAYRENGGVNWRQWQQGNAANSGQKWTEPGRSRSNGGVQNVGNARRSGQQKRHATGRPVTRLASANRQRRRNARQRFDPFSVYGGPNPCLRTTRQSQSRLGGNPHGFSGRLDFPGWPARPNEPQYPYEPPRVTSDQQPQRAARLKALGNAVVPQVAYPLFLALYEWLQEQIKSEAA